MKLKIVDIELGKTLLKSGFDIPCLSYTNLDKYYVPMSYTDDEYELFVNDKIQTWHSDFISRELMYVNDSSTNIYASKEDAHKDGEKVTIDDVFVIPAPEMELVRKWLRDEYNIFINIEIDTTSYPKFCYSIYKHNENLTECENLLAPRQYSDLYREYEEALGDGLRRALDFMK